MATSTIRVSGPGWPDRSASAHASWLAEHYSKAGVGVTGAVTTAGLADASLSSAPDCDLSHRDSGVLTPQGSSGILSTFLCDLPSGGPAARR